MSTRLRGDGYLERVQAAVKNHVANATVHVVPDNPHIIVAAKVTPEVELILFDIMLNDFGFKLVSVTSAGYFVGSRYYFKEV